LRAKIEKFMEEALIKRRSLHWLEMLTMFIIALSGEQTKAGPSPRHMYLKTLSAKYPKVVDELYKVAVLAKSIKAQQ